MKLIKLSAILILFVCLYSCNTDRPHKIYDEHAGTPTNADSVLYNLHHGTEGAHHDVQAELPRVFWR